MKIDKELAKIATELANTNPSACMKCGKCSGRCPSFNEMEYHPHQFVSYVEKGRLEELMESDSIWNCLSCMACVERCPRGVAPADLVEAVRLLVVRQQGKNHLAPEDIPEKLDSELPQQALMSAFRKYSK
jgi:heterodisulfide reductase subunit C